MKKSIVLLIAALFACMSTTYTNASSDDMQTIPLKFLTAIYIPSNGTPPTSSENNASLNQLNAYSSIQAMNIVTLTDGTSPSSIIQTANLTSVSLNQISSLNSFQAINYVGN